MTKRKPGRPKKQADKIIEVLKPSIDQALVISMIDEKTEKEVEIIRYQRYDLFDERTRAHVGSARKIGEMRSKDNFPLGCSFKHNGGTFRVHEVIVEDDCIKLYVK